MGTKRRKQGLERVSIVFKQDACRRGRWLFFLLPFLVLSWVSVTKDGLTGEKHTHLFNIIFM